MLGRGVVQPPLAAEVRAVAAVPAAEGVVVVAVASGDLLVQKVDIAC